MNKKNNFKLDRIDSEIKKALQVIIFEDLKDPRIISQVNITEVITSKDLSYCKIYVQSEQDNKEELIKVLNNSKGFLKSKIAKSLILRRIPELHFEYDNSLDNYNRIEELLKSIK